MRRPSVVALILAITLSAAAIPAATFSAEQITTSVAVQYGPVNTVTISRGDNGMAVYGAANSKPEPDFVLLTHHRRDIVWAARQATAAGGKLVAPRAEQPLLADPQKFWDDFTTRRFHDYAQQSTKVVGRPLDVDRWVEDGDELKWQGVTFRTVDTPGFTRGAVSYLAEVDGQRIVFTGDLIYGDGQLFDLYSLQDAIPSAKIGGYHGYASRLGSLVPSLRKIAKLNPDLLIPARGPVIRDPQASIQKLIDRVQSVYRNYLSTNALNWYFKEERMTISGKRVLGDDADVQLMSYSLHQKTPGWVWEQGTSRMLISDNGRGFLLDCGNPRVLEAAKKLVDSGLVSRVDGIFVTHYHDDHTNNVAEAAGVFRCPVYATVEYEDVLERPGAYHLPALTDNAIQDVTGLKSGHKMSWEEFELTFHFYPGQTLYHGALEVKKKGEQTILFIGDAFSPSGIDDYCLLNRNLIHQDSGYFFCLDKLRQMKEDFWLVNEHIPYVFKFSDKELTYLESRYRARKKTLAQLFPWDDPNYGIDEQWAVGYPYGTTVEPGKVVDLEVRLMNHSPKPRTFKVTPHLPDGWKLVRSDKPVVLESRGTGAVKFQVQTNGAAGNYIVTADVQSNGMDFRRWTESLISVERASR